MCGFISIHGAAQAAKAEYDRQRIEATVLSPIFAAVEHKGRWLPVYEGRSNIPRVERKGA
ncbi:hypothetical protein [Roseovarius indicus]|uniref:Uncharacterized protein n=1 Tax=Roseovarius indicus TaxID=540747 RepID=A0A0T5P3Q4_9RHOB|nr:hypothetical protein [Roseovarius indicus]KRS15636.1 hypothetical protein XM52_22610 [Roseovarius indicus]QEW27857.1 hypothetical protein RIdsm_03678 [Roseovarius indicus]SFE79164.1 hypothetical protein SAMN04488031_1229 [Roseovarius indicus]